MPTDLEKLTQSESWVAYPSKYDSKSSFILIYLYSSYEHNMASQFKNFFGRVLTTPVGFFTVVFRGLWRTRQAQRPTRNSLWPVGEEGFPCPGSWPRPWNGWWWARQKSNTERKCPGKWRSLSSPRSRKLNSESQICSSQRHWDYDYVSQIDLLYFSEISLIRWIFCIFLKATKIFFY